MLPLAEIALNLIAGPLFLAVEIGPLLASDEEFGEERALVRAAPASCAGELDRAILESVSGFCGGNFHDDATLVVLTVHGAGGSGGESDLIRPAALTVAARLVACC